VESRTGPLRLIVRNEDEGKIGEREDGEEEKGKDRRKRGEMERRKRRKN
jgi:hypothetical protein